VRAESLYLTKLAKHDMQSILWCTALTEARRATCSGMVSSGNPNSLAGGNRAFKMIVVGLGTGQ
jgi:hypothetical protein